MVTRRFKEAADVDMVEQWVGVGGGNKSCVVTSRGANQQGRDCLG